MKWEHRFCEISIGSAFAIGGAVLDYNANKKAGKREAARSLEQKVYNDIAAGQRVAVGQRRSHEELRQSKLKASRAVAVAAAGGASGDIDHLIADIEGEGIYRASIATFEAETEAERLRFEGEQGLKTGRDRKKFYDNKAVSSLLSAGGSLYKGTRSSPSKIPYYKPEYGFGRGK